MPEEDKRMAVLAQRANAGGMGAEVMTPAAPGEAAPGEAEGDATLNAVNLMIKMSDAIKNGEPRLSMASRKALSKATDLLHEVQGELVEAGAPAPGEVAPPTEEAPPVAPEETPLAAEEVIPEEVAGKKRRKAKEATPETAGARAIPAL